MKRALLIGIDYIGTNNYLSGCIDDVNNSYQLLKTQYGYDEILLLTDATRFQPFQSVIYKGLDWLLSDQPSSSFQTGKKYNASSKNLELFVHYSGHGTNDCWCPLDADKGYQRLISGQVLQEKLIRRLNNNSSLTLLMDCCHSGNMLKLGYSSQVSLTSGNIITAKVDTNVHKGTIVCLAGCTDSQTSANVTIDHKGEGVLTYSLIQVLSSSSNLNYGTLLPKIQEYILLNHLSQQTPVLTYNRQDILQDKFLNS